MTSARIAALADDPAFATLKRSLNIYYGDDKRTAAMDALYRRFLKSGDLAFDIGAHVGDRIGSFRRLGARVVAVEPQPLCIRVIQSIYAGDNDFILFEGVCGDRPGIAKLNINSVNPTISTVSADFMRAADGAPNWEGEVWDRTIDVPSTTLDTLIAEHGVPAFAKIDVEGFEDAVLAGLSHPLETLSFEFTTIQRDVAMECLDRLSSLGAYRFDVALGESQTFTFNRWISSADMAAHIKGLPHAANAGDIYCMLHR
jgi:FkbM family methyltransferase